MEEKKNKTNKKLSIIIITLILAMLCTFGYFACRKIKDNDAKKKFFSAVDKLFTEVANEEKKEDFKTFSGDYTVTMDINSRFIDQEIQDIINKLKLNFKLDFDKENNNYNLSLNSTYDNDKLLNGQLTGLDNKLYLFLDDIYSKWIKVDSTTNINTNSLLTNEDYELLAKELEKALNHALKNTYFKKEVIDDLNKYTLTIDKDNSSIIINDLLDYLENSKEFIKVYEKVSNTKFSDVTKKIKKETKLLTAMDPILVSISTDKKDNLKEIAFETSISNEKIKVVYEIKDIHNIKLTIYDDDVAMVSGSIEEETKDNNKTLNIKLSMMGMFTAKLKVVSNTKYNDKITLPTVTDSIDSNDLTEEDMESIYTKIFNNQGLVKIVEAIENYTNKNEEM